MCGFSEWIKNRGVRSNSRQYEVNLECFSSILHGSDGVWARMGEKPVNSMWKEYTTSLRESGWAICINWCSVAQSYLRNADQ